MKSLNKMPRKYLAVYEEVNKPPVAILAPEVALYYKF
jgi:hypothetical protein